MYGTMAGPNLVSAPMSMNHIKKRLEMFIC
jgi:hypothetical protein